MTDEDLKKLAEEIVYRKDPKMNLTGHPRTLEALVKVIESALRHVRAETIEECAKVADRISDNHIDRHEACCCGEEIRAQKEKR